MSKHLTNVTEAQARAWALGNQHAPTMVAVYNARQVAVFYARQFAR